MVYDYKKAGVNTLAGDELVDWLKDQKPDSSIAKNDKISELRKHLRSGVGGFASLFDLEILKKYKSPQLITCTDGVGTKVKLASHFKDFSSVGQDLVAMCVNDLICCGGDPFLFLDYYATGQLKLEYAKSFLVSVQKACDESRCLLVGGETAEMPGVYVNDDFDCAGFAVGVVDREKMWGPELVREGDVLLGLESSGFHSNGYSLVRKLFSEDLDKFKDQLLRPTKLYVQATQLLKERGRKIHAAAHITGGGIDNVPRVLPLGLNAKIDIWKFDEIFKIAQLRSGLSDIEMLKTFNCGVGFVLVCSKEESVLLQNDLSELSIKSFLIGKVVKGDNETDEASCIFN
jgi:phosphoribosylformylglycinamidine cyclo-ligase